MKTDIDATGDFAGDFSQGASSPPAGTAVLVIDDEPSVRHAAAVVLRRAGLIVESASDGQEALAKFAADPSRHAVVLLDMRVRGTMPTPRPRGAQDRAG